MARNAAPRPLEKKWCGMGLEAEKRNARGGTGVCGACEGLFSCAAENTSVPELLEKVFSRKQGNVLIWTSIQIILCKIWPLAFWRPMEQDFARPRRHISSEQHPNDISNTKYSNSLSSYIPSIIVLSVWLNYWSLVMWQFIYPHHRLISCL